MAGCRRGLVNSWPCSSKQPSFVMSFAVYLNRTTVARSRHDCWRIKTNNVYWRYLKAVICEQGGSWKPGSRQKRNSAYGIIEVADYLRVPRKTVEYWWQGEITLGSRPSTSAPRFNLHEPAGVPHLERNAVEGSEGGKVRRALNMSGQCRRSIPCWTSFSDGQD